MKCWLPPAPMRAPPMHELAVCQGLIDAVERVARRERARA